MKRKQAPTIFDILKFRGQILLTEKLKKKGDCSCFLCDPDILNQTAFVLGKILPNFNCNINPDHFDSIKIFVPISKTRFKNIQKILNELSLELRENLRSKNLLLTWPRGEL